MTNKPDYNNAYKFGSDSGNESIGTIYLTGGGYVNRPFKGFSPDSKYGWEELVWGRNPSRYKGTFALTNMDNIEVGLVARCELNVKYLNLDDYIALRKILGRERHCVARFFNVDDCEWITREMYCSEATVNKLFSLHQSLIGVLDYSIKLVGTNNDLITRINGEGSESTTLRQMIITFNPNGGIGELPKSEKISWGGQFKIPECNLIPPSGKSRFECWVTKNGESVSGKYVENQSITVWKDLELYAQWV